MSSEDSSLSGSETSHTRVIIGSIVISFLGILFGVTLIVAGSFLTWRSDTVIGIFSQSGWRFENLIAGDGKISWLLGIIAFPSLVFGAVLRRKVFYGIALLCSAGVLLLSIYELAFLFTRPGVVGPGHGLYMICGGSVITLLCSLGGYLMTGEKRSDSEGRKLQEEPSGL